MKIRMAAAALVLFVGSTFAADVKSGPQVGEKVPGPFHPLNINGSAAGKKNCLFCSNGQRPVAMIFARDVDSNLVELIKKIDGATTEDKTGSFVVFLSDDKNLEKKLEDVAKKESLKQCVLSIDNPAGPKGYHVSEKADVTVVLYKERKVEANYSFGKGELKAADVESIVKTFEKISK